MAIADTSKNDGRGVRYDNAFSIGLVIASLAAYFVMLAARDGLGDIWENYPDAYLLCVSVLALLTVLSLVRAGYGMASAPVMIGLLMWVLHFGLSVVTIFAPDVVSRIVGFGDWVGTESWMRGSLYAWLCLVGYVIGCAWCKVLAPPTKADGRSFQECLASLRCDSLYYGGATLVAFGLLWLLYGFLRAGGPAVFGMRFIETRSDVFPLMSTGFTLFSIGFPLALCGAGTPRRWLLPVVVQAGIMAFVLSLGARKIAMYQAITLLVLLSALRVRIPAWKLLLIGVLILSLSAAVRTMREGGFRAGRSFVIKADSAIEAVAELGGTMQTVAITLDNVDAGGTVDTVGGKGYVAALFQVFRDRSASSYADPYSFANFVMQYFDAGLGGGGSSIGESFYNFGWWGSLFVFLPMGFVVSCLQLRANTATRLAVLGIATYSVLFWTRDYFAAVTTYAIYSFFFWRLQDLWAIIGRNSRSFALRRAERVGGSS